MALSAPLNVHWELTNVCNLKCVHCYQQDDGPRGGLPSREQTDLIADRIIDGGVFEVTLTGGEVLLVPQLPDLVALFNRSGIRPHLTSNGMLVDERAADWIAAVDLTFQVSIDAADPAVHNDIRRSPYAFDRALAGVRRLVERGVEVSFAYTATSGNLDDVSAVVALAAEEGVRRVCIGEVLPEFGSLATRQRLAPEFRRFGDFITDLHGLRERHRGRVDVAIALLSGHRYDPGLRDSPCTALDRDLAVLYDGWAYPCPFVRNPAARLGNLLDSSIEEIWSGPAAARFRRDKTAGASKPCVSGPPTPRPVPVSIDRRSEPRWSSEPLLKDA